MSLTRSFAQSPLLSRRYSARLYNGEPISPEALRSLLEAARWAPSSRNGQPWSFIVAPRQDREAFETLLACLAENNQRWAKDAAVLMACVALDKWEDRDLPNQHAWHDVGLAVMAMAVQGVQLGLQMREMGGVDRDKTRAQYGIPATHSVVSALAVGVPAEGGPDHPRERKPLNEFVFQGAWGRACPLPD